MSLRRFLVPDGLISQDEITLPKEESLHAVKVLRLKPGAKVEIIDGSGDFAIASINQVGKKSVSCQVLERGTKKPLSPKLVLCCGLLKKGAMDMLATKLTELAVDEIRTFSSSRSEGRVKDASKRIERWERTALQALKQSGAPKIPCFKPPCEFEKLLTKAPAAALKIMLYESQDETFLSGVLKRHEEVKEVWCLIGPEGGFSIEEVAIAQENGFVIAGLKGTILRAQTASLAVASVVRFGL